MYKLYQHVKLPCTNIKLSNQFYLLIIIIFFFIKFRVLKYVCAHREVRRGGGGVVRQPPRVFIPHTRGDDLRSHWSK